MNATIPPDEVQITYVEIESITDADGKPLDVLELLPAGLEIPPGLEMPSHAIVAEWDSPQGRFKMVDPSHGPLSGELLERLRPGIVAKLEREYLAANAGREDEAA
jgi:hypothetical protein